MPWILNKPFLVGYSPERAVKPSSLCKLDLYLHFEEMARTRGRGRGRARASITARNLTTAVKIEAPQEEEPEERQFVRPGKISPHLFCVICSEVFNKPYRAPCGHSFCLNVSIYFFLITTLATNCFIPYILMFLPNFSVSKHGLAKEVAAQ